MEKDNKSLILHFAEEINAINDLAGIERSYLKNSKNLDKDICNMQVTLLTMCVNREIRICMDGNKNIKKFCLDIKYKYNEFNRNIVKDIKLSELSKKGKFIFERYLNKIVGCLLSGIKHEKLNSYEREERVRDNMKGLITHNVADIKCTIEHGIEIPYMYILAWDLPNLYKDMKNIHLDYSKLNFVSEEKAEELNKTSYIRNLHSNIIDYFSHISDNMIDILLHNESYADDEKEKKDNYNKKKGILIKPLVFEKKKSFKGLLPTIKFVDENDGKEQINYKDNNENFDSKRETLDRIPLLPKYINKNDFEVDKAMDMMVRLVRKENEIKEYDLSQEITNLSDRIIAVCRYIIDYIRHDKDNKLLVMDKDLVVNYLEIIQVKANCLPRDDNEDKRQNYINVLVDSICNFWTYETFGKYNLEKNVIDKNKNIIDYERYACFSALKNARNWIAHPQNNQNFDIIFLVFIFAVSVRFLLKQRLVEDFYFGYGEKMSKLFEIVPTDVKEYEELDEQTIIAAYKKLYMAVKRNCFEYNKNYFDTQLSKGGYKDFSFDYIKPHDLFAYLGNNKSKYAGKLSQGDVGASFWLALHMRSCSEAEKKVFDNSKPDLTKHLIGIANIIQKESTILNM